MTDLAIPLPSLTEADPVVAGEGSLDPLGLALVADRLAEHLLPGLRARMRRVRFLTLAAAGALATDELGDAPPADGMSTPSICFEWLVLEAFARRGGKGAPLEASGVPGSTKVRSVLAQGKRLAYRNYLKSPSVFGFTGVYLPLARHLRVLDDERHPAANIAALTNAWEKDNGLTGFTNASLHTEGGRLRERIRTEVRAALSAGQCTTEPGAHLWSQLAECMHPLRPGPSERRLLAAWLTSSEEPVRAQLASFLAGQPLLSEAELVDSVFANHPSDEVRVRLTAMVAYEGVARLLDAAFHQLRYRSMHLGSVALSPAEAARDEIIAKVAQAIPAAMLRASDRLAFLDSGLLTLFTDRLGRFAVRMTPAEFVESIMAQHESVQAAKPPKGKRPWFDRYGAGWVVRSPYWTEGAADLEGRWFVHPYRMASLQAFMKDLSP